MEQQNERLKMPESTAKEERVVYSDGTVAYIFTKSEKGGDIFFDGPHTYIPRTPQSPRVSEVMILKTVDGSYALGSGVFLEGTTGDAYDVAEIGKRDFPEKITVGESFEIPGVFVTPEVTAVGFEYSMSYFTPGKPGDSGATLSPFREAAEILGRASRHFNEEFPGRQSIAYDEETGEAYSKVPEGQPVNNKPESLLRRLGRTVFNR